MKKILLLIPIVALLAAGCGSSAKNPAQSQPTKSTENNPPPAEATSLPPSTLTDKFTLKDYYSNAYLVSGDKLAADAQKALSVFTINKQTAADGSSKISIVSSDPQYKSQDVSLKPGYTLYIIMGSGNQKSLKDGSVVMVSSMGDVVNQ